MKKIFLIHGYDGTPNGGWRPWLMGELDKKEIYCSALSMPNPAKPVCSEWVEEIFRHVEINKKDEISLVGHSLGVPAILRFLESYKGKKISKMVTMIKSYLSATERSCQNYLVQKLF